MKPKRIICFGDSLTWGYMPAQGRRHPAGVRWTSLLGELLGCEVAEEGLSGRTSVFRDPFLPYGCAADAIEGCVASQMPADLLTIMLGTNDFKAYIDASPRAVAGGVIQVANKAHALAPRLPILIICPHPIGYHISQLDDELGILGPFDRESIEGSRQLASQLEPLADYMGYSFFDAGTVVHSSREDDVHLDRESNRILAEALARFITEEM